MSADDGSTGRPQRAADDLAYQVSVLEQEVTALRR